MQAHDLKAPARFLLFADVHQGKLDLYNGRPTTPDEVEYFQKLVKLDPKDHRAAAAFFFEYAYAEGSGPGIAHDALTELNLLPYGVLRVAAQDFPANRLAGVLADKKAPLARRRHAAFLLGHCGTAKDFIALERHLGESKEGKDLDGVFVGLTLLRSKEGLVLMRKTLSDAKQEFAVRYAALRALRFLADFRPDVLSRAQIAAAIELGLDQPDLADLAINALLALRDKNSLERVLAVPARKDHDIPIIRRAVLRFALTFRDDPAASRFVETMRAKDQELVAALEELLKLEAEANPPGGKRGPK